jgi:filamentous hemagglutinin
MRIPNASQAIVEPAKILQYLLDTSHPVGGAKARFFLSFGFSREEYSVLVRALQRHATDNEVTTMHETAFGPRYEVEGQLVCPDGRRPVIVTVWQFDVGQIAPRLITAYPN